MSWVNLDEEELKFIKVSLRLLTPAMRICLGNLNEKVEKALAGPTDREAKYLARAEEISVDGECEIDDDAIVSEGEDHGAYVMGWIWVDAEDAGVEKPSEEE